jgi:hypothetical protein
VPEQPPRWQQCRFVLGCAAVLQLLQARSAPHQSMYIHAIMQAAAAAAPLPGIRAQDSVGSHHQPSSRLQPAAWPCLQSPRRMCAAAVTGDTSVEREREQTDTPLQPPETPGLGLHTAGGRCRFSCFEGCVLPTISTGWGVTQAGGQQLLSLTCPPSSSAPALSLDWAPCELAWPGRGF